MLKLPLTTVLKQMNIFIENICFAQNNVNDLELDLTTAPSMLKFDVACRYFYTIKLPSFLKSFNAIMTCNLYHCTDAQLCE